VYNAEMVAAPAAYRGQCHFLFIMHQKARGAKRVKGAAPGRSSCPSPAAAGEAGWGSPPLNPPAPSLRSRTSAVGEAGWGFLVPTVPMGTPARAHRVASLLIGEELALNAVKGLRTEPSPLQEVRIGDKIMTTDHLAAPQRRGTTEGRRRRDTSLTHAITSSKLLIPGVS